MLPILHTHPHDAPHDTTPKEQEWVCRGVGGGVTHNHSFANVRGACRANFPSSCFGVSTMCAIGSGESKMKLASDEK